MSGQSAKNVRLKIECTVIPEKDLQFQTLSDSFMEGAYGKVCRATYEGKDVAVKYFKSAEEKSGYKQELVFLKCLQNHDQIVVLFGTGSSRKTKEPYIVMEFAPYSLEKVLHGVSPRYEYGAGHVMHWSRQTAVGLKYIHSKRILHRDIKSSNLLLFGNGSHLKLCDFGTCRNMQTNLLYTASIGTVRYMAPEVIQGDPYTTMCDIFSFAITLWEMLARKVPTIDIGSAHLNSYAILYQMVQGKRPPLLARVPQFINELLTSCWDQDPGKRLSSADLEKKLTKVCEFFPFEDLLLSSNEGEEEDEEIDDDDEEEEEEVTAVPVINEPAAPSAQSNLGLQPIVRTQSDMSFAKTASTANVVTTAQSPPDTLTAQTSEPFAKKPTEHFYHGYPPRDVYAGPKYEVSSSPLETSSVTLRDSHVVVDHEFRQEVDPHTEEMKYISLDENRLRFDIQRQYLQIEQAYQPLSLPNNPHVNRTRQSIDATTRGRTQEQLQYSSFAASGSGHIQPVLPDENDPESVRMFEQFQKLSEELART